MPDHRQIPEWMAREIMEHCRRVFPMLGATHSITPAEYAAWSFLSRPLPDVGPDFPTEEEKLAALGYDGSRRRRRYWKKVTER